MSPQMDIKIKKQFFQNHTSFQTILMKTQFNLLQVAQSLKTDLY